MEKAQYEKLPCRKEKFWQGRELLQKTAEWNSQRLAAFAAWSAKSVMSFSSKERFSFRARFSVLSSSMVTIFWAIS